MSNVFGIRSIGLSALRGTQTAISTTGHNIANLNTEGFSRQRTEFQTNTPQVLSRFNLGTGVAVGSISRIVSEFVDERLTTQTSNSSRADMFLNLAARLDNAVGSDSTSLAPALEGFFNAVQAVADEPGSVQQRQILINEADSLTRRFGLLEGRFDEVESAINFEVRESVAEVNRLAASVAGLNKQIIGSSGLANRPNDLLDQRDELVRQLATNLDVSVLKQEDGSLNVFTVGGQSLVIGTLTSDLQLTTNPFDLTRQEVANASGVNVTRSMTGGSLGAALAFRAEVLDPAVNAFGRVAVGMAQTFNAQHQLGMDLNGALGGAFFTPPSASVQPAATNTGGTVSAQFTDVGALTTSDYTLTFDGGNAYTLTRDSDGQATAIDTGGASPFTTAAVDGFTLTISAGAAVGDSFKVRPTADGAENIGVAISAAFQVAAASPVRSQATLANQGDGALGSVTVNSVNNLPLSGLPVSGTLTLTFNSATNQVTLVPDPLGEGPLAFDPSTDAAGKSFTLLGGDVSFTLSGTPANGDTFTLSHNSGGTGDNRNALALAGIQTRRTLDNGSQSVSEAFGQVVTDVASHTQVAQISQEAFSGLLEQAQADRQQISGVNLDEEAANLVRFQQAYQAAAQLLGVVDTLFQTILASVRG